MNPLLREALDRLDVAAASRLYRAASVRPDRERARLRAAGRPHLAPDGPTPSWEELRATSDWIIDQARSRRTVLTRLTSLVGAPSVPSEVVARSVGVLRLAQRLALVHGFDPRDDRGQAALRRALAAGLGRPEPEGHLHARLSEIARGSRPSAGGQLVRAVVGEASADAVRGPERLLPLLGLVRADAPLRAVGQRMAEVFRRLTDLPASGEIIDVAEVRPADRAPSADPPGAQHDRLIDDR